MPTLLVLKWKTTNCNNTLFMWPFYFILALGMGLMSLVACLQFIEDIHSYVKGDHFTAEVEAATDV